MIIRFKADKLTMIYAAKVLKFSIKFEIENLEKISDEKLLEQRV